MTYLDDIGKEIGAELSSDQMPAGDTDALMRLYAVLALAKGGSTTSEDVHNAWVAWMTEIDPNHDALRPFSELDTETRQEDGPFVGAIRTVAKRRGF